MCEKSGRKNRDFSIVPRAVNLSARWTRKRAARVSTITRDLRALRVLRRDCSAAVEFHVESRSSHQSARSTDLLDIVEHRHDHP